MRDQPGDGSQARPPAVAPPVPVLVLVLAGVFVVALLARLVPMLRGGGLTGLGSYDDGVHYAAAATLVHGRWLYRDTLFLQPPGIAVLLTPFALVGRLVGDATGLALARLAFMVLGSLTAVLVARLLRPLGVIAMGIGGLFYALFLPATYVDRTTLLEGPGNTLLVVALLLLSRARTRPRHASWLLTGAGVALGFSVSIKIWAAAAVAVVVVALWFGRSWRPALRLAVTAVATGAAVALPFLVVAPRQLWQMVVTDQLGRRRTGSEYQRLNHLAGLSRWDLGAQPSLPLAITLLGLLVALVLAATVPRGRLAAAIFVVDGCVLMAAPSSFLHYGALVAVPAAIVVGVGTARLLALVGARVGPPARQQTVRRAVGAVLVLGLVVWAAPLVHERFGHRFPAAELAPVARAVRGCVSADTPSALLLLGVFGQNLDRGCPGVIDLGGASYHPPLQASSARAGNERWQPYALAYLRQANLTIVTRFRSGFGFDRATAREVQSWPVVTRAGNFKLRRPS